jgi:hypothetical protein
MDKSVKKILKIKKDAEKEVVKELKKEISQVKTQLKLKMKDQITPTLKRAGKKMDQVKIIKMIEVLITEHQDKQYCLMSSVIAKKIVTECCKTKLTDEESQAFQNFFKDALKKGTIQLGGASGGGFLSTCGYTIGGIVGVLLCCTVVLAPLGMALIGGLIATAAYNEEEEIEKRRKREELMKMLKEMK